MTKQKIIIISLITAICLILVGIGGFFGVREYLKNRITFDINDTLPDGNGRQAKVILLGGQSNASGCSRVEYLQKKVSEEKFTEYSNGYDNVYINFYSTKMNKSDGFVKCSTSQGESLDYFGPELGIAEWLNTNHPNELFFIIKCAWGATDLFEKWLSPSSDGPTGRLYKEFVTFVETSMRYLKSKNYDVKIEGMCWMQGESDSFSTEHATQYKDHLANLIKDIRKKFSKYSAADGLAFIDAYIADNPVYWVYCDLVNQSKDAVKEMSPLNALIDTISHGLKCSEEPEGTPDMAHYDSLSQIKLGNLFAQELARYMF